jgi:hypothetical protein
LKKDWLQIPKDAPVEKVQECNPVNKDPSNYIHDNQKNWNLKEKLTPTKSIIHR